MREFIRRALLKTARMNSEQMQSLLALVTEEYEILDSVLDSVTTGIVICDSFHIMIQTNKAAPRILPMEIHDMQDRPVWAFIRDHQVADFIRTAIENEETVTAREFTLESVSGTRYISLSVMPLVRHKRVRGTVITYDDITAKKNEELRNRRLESLASLTNLAATVAHEIKNPLGSISIYIQLIRKALNACPSHTEQPIDKYLNIVDEEIDRLNKIVVDFLFAVRPIRLEFAPMQINDLLRGLTEFFAGEFNQAGISLDLALQENLPLIQGDERFLRQMLINLVKNAMAATGSGGLVRLTSSRSEEYVQLTVEDSGEGIPENLLQKIFEPYFTTKVDGTGLGLTMAYKVVKEHGGDIGVQSEEGRGTCFTIKLPVLKKAQKMIEFEEYRKE